MKRLVALLLCICAIVFVSCDSGMFDKNTGTDSSSSGDGAQSGSVSKIKFDRPDALHGVSPSEDSYVRLTLEMVSTEEGGPTYDYSDIINLNALSSVEIPDIADGTYDIYAWVDNFSPDKDKTPFYNIEGLNEISISTENYATADLESKVAYYVNEKNVVVSGNKELDIELKFPNGGYSVMLKNPYTKLGKGGSGFKAIVTYPQFVPSAFSIRTEKTIASVTNIGFTMSLPEITEQMEQVCIAKDLVLCKIKNSDGTPATNYVYAVIRIVDGSGETVYESAMLMLTVEPGKVNEQIME